MAATPDFYTSTFGAGGLRWGPMSSFGGRTHVESERFKDLDRRQQFYDCTQHDWKRFDFDGRVTTPGIRGAVQPLITAEKVHWYVPLSQRRPSAPYRIGKVIVDSFTNLLFGDNRFPELVSDDFNTQDWARTLADVGMLPSRMIRARNIGGSTGTVGLSWSFLDGKPRYEVHHGKNLFVHEWDSRDELIPRHVSEIYWYPNDEFDQRRRTFVRNWYWYRRDWLPDADLCFLPALVRPGEEPVWMLDEERSNVHKDRLCHLTWLQNLPSEDIDGLTDYDGLYDNFDALDLLNSVLQRGITLNLDPTLVLKMDPDLVRARGVSKGSDNALIVGEGGSADYLEMNGAGITAGLAVFESMRRSTLEAAQCVVPDPAVVAAQGISSVAIKAMFAPMLAKGDVLRTQYGGGIRRATEGPATIARARRNARVYIYEEVTNDAGETEERTVLGDDGNPVEAEQVVDLPPRIEQREMEDRLTGEKTMVEVPVQRDPGEGERIDARWGPWFPLTPDDQQKQVQTFSTATGGKQFLSTSTVAELAARTFGVDPDIERQRLAEDEKRGVEQRRVEAGSFDADLGGRVPG